MTAGPHGVLPPEETLTVVGGAPLTRVDAQDVLAAAALLDDAAAGLRAVARHCAAVGAALRRWTWVPDPGAAPFAPGPGAHEIAAAWRAGDLAHDAADRLDARAGHAERLAARLRFAAGLYGRAEPLTERVLGGIVEGWALVPGMLGGVVLSRPEVRLSVGALTVARSLTGRTAPDGGSPPPVPPDSLPPVAAETTADRDGLGSAALRAWAPMADEVVAGLARGLDLTAPPSLSPWPRDPAAAAGPDAGPDTGLGVTGAARPLADLVDAILPASEVEVLPLGDGDLTAGPPAWADRPSGTVAEALARTADLYPQGGGMPGRPGAGAPAGTLAVEEVTHADGTTSWTVLLPGTQALVSASHPFDGVTDLDLMAHRAADVSAAVEQALEASGAEPDEPVVLVGHSLGGISAVALAASPGFRRRHRVGGVVTAGAPTATFTAPRGVPVLHLENAEELVSPLDGRPSAENPASRDRVTVGRRLLDSADPADRAASGSVALAHGTATHLRTLAAARASGNVQVADVTGRLDRLLDGQRSRTRFFAARRTHQDAGLVLAPGPDGVSPSSGRTLR